MSRVGQLLREAAAHVERGWCQGWLYEWDEDESRPTNVCAIGAIELAAKRYDAFARSVATDALRVYGIGDPIVSVAEWNDREGRTQAEVVAALNLAAIIHDEHVAAIGRDCAPTPKRQPKPAMA